ncbi:hypothetical protein [Xanthomonas phage RTH11]|nr:hypothetical protein [Xanthomonas phage RTH11]
MSDEKLPLATDGPNGFDQILQPTSPRLDQVPLLTDDQTLDLARRIRLRQIAIDLNNNGGEMPVDPEDRKVFQSNLKELEAAAAKNKLTGVKEKISAVDKLAAETVQRVIQQLGTSAMRVDPIAGQATRERPSISDAADLPPVDTVPDEMQVGVDSTTFDELMERNGQGE